MTTAITDDDMRALLTKARNYTVVLLHAAADLSTDEARAVIWEHGRRNMALRAAGKLAIVCPVTDDTDLCGIGIFTDDAPTTADLLDGDPCIQAGLMTYEVHPVRSFPGDTLPG
jgi:hypothetical protein